MFYAVLSNLSLLLQVFLIAHEENDHVWFTLRHNLFVPRIETLESLQSRDVVSQEYAVSSPVEYLGDALELLLTCCVPNLELEDSLFELDEQCAELYAYCDLMVRHKFIIGESVEEAGLSNRRIPYYYKLEQEILVKHALVLQDLVVHLVKRLHHMLKVFLV